MTQHSFLPTSLSIGLCDAHLNRISKERIRKTNVHVTHKSFIPNLKLQATKTERYSSNGPP